MGFFARPLFTCWEDRTETSHRAHSGEPLALGGEDTAPNPVEQLLAALGNCLAVGFTANASVAGIELKSLRVELAGDLELKTFLGLDDGDAGYETITARGC